MMQRFGTILAILAAGSAVWAAENSIWQGDLAKATLREGAKLKDISVKADEQKLLNINATSEGDSVTYVSAIIDVAPFKVAGKALALQAWSDTPAETVGFYVRGLDKNNKKVISYQAWNRLRNQPETFILVPGRNSSGMMWEAGEVQVPADTEISKLQVYIGARGPGKKMTLKFGDVKLVDAPAAPAAKAAAPAPAVKLAGAIRPSGPGKVTESNGVYTATATAGKDVVTYFSWRMPFTADLAGRTLRFTAETSTPELTKAFYVRGYNAKGECTLSYMSWQGLLGKAPKEFILVPGQNSEGLVWEKAVAKAAGDPKLATLEFYIGTRGNAGKTFDGKIGNIRVGE